MSEKIRIIGCGWELDPKTLFAVGRIGLSVCIMSFGIMLLSGKTKQEDLVSYFNFWQYLAPRSYGAAEIGFNISVDDEIKAFSKESFFEF